MDGDELTMWELSEHQPLWDLTQRVSPVCPEACAVGKFILCYLWQCFYSPNTLQTGW